MNDHNTYTKCPKCHQITLITYTFPDRRELECANPDCVMTKTLSPLPRVEISFTIGNAQNHPLCFGRVTVTQGAN